MSASDKDSSDHHYNTVYFKIAGGDKVSGEGIIPNVVRYLLDLYIDEYFILFATAFHLLSSLKQFHLKDSRRRLTKGN